MEYSGQNFPSPKVSLIISPQKISRLIFFWQSKTTLISKGEYLIFPDPDDILAQDILNTCYQYSKVNNYEIIRYNLFDQRENDIFYNSIVSKLDSKRIEQPELFYYLFYGLGKLK